MRADPRCQGRVSGPGWVALGRSAARWPTPTRHHHDPEGLRLPACRSQWAPPQSPGAATGPRLCWIQNLGPQNLSPGVPATPALGEGPPLGPACAQVGLMPCPGRPAVSQPGWAGRGWAGLGPLPPATEVHVLQAAIRICGSSSLDAVGLDGCHSALRPRSLLTGHGLPRPRCKRGDDAVRS